MFKDRNRRLLSYEFLYCDYNTFKLETKTNLIYLI